MRYYRRKARVLNISSDFYTELPSLRAQDLTMEPVQWNVSNRRNIEPIDLKKKVADQLKERDKQIKQYKANRGLLITN